MLTAFAVFVLVHGSPAVAVTSTGPTCEGADLGDRVAHYLDAVEGTTPTPLKIEADLAEADGIWRLQLRYGDEGSRTFRARRCETVVDAAAFVVAVAIDPAVADVVDGPELSDPEPEPEPEPLPEPEPDPAPVSAPVPAPLPAPLPAPDPDPDPPLRQSPRFLAPSLGASVGIDGGALPKVGALFRGTVGFGGNHWRVEVGGQFRTRTEVTSELDADAGGRIGGWAILARGCGIPTIDAFPVEFPLCAGVEGGQVLGRGFGFDGARDATLPWLAITAHAGFAIRISWPFAVYLAAEGGVSPLRGQLVIDNLETIHDVGLGFGRGMLGIRWRFWPTWPG